MKCKTCGKNADSEYCFIHKPRKPLANGKSFTKTEKRYNPLTISNMRNFFIRIWDTRPHFSEVSGQYLGNEPLHYYFHHILPKNKYPDAALDKENIVLLTLDEHTNVEGDMYKYEEVNNRRNQLKIKYEQSRIN